MDQGAQDEVKKPRRAGNGPRNLRPAGKEQS